MIAASPPGALALAFSLAGSPCQGSDSAIEVEERTRQTGEPGSAPVA